MHFKNKENKQKRKREINTYIRNALNALFSPLFKIKEIRETERKKYDIKNIHKIKEKALKELIEEVERKLLNTKSEVRVYKDADLDTSDISIEKEFAAPFGSLKNCRKYYHLLLEKKEELDIDYFYYSVLEYFKSYKDLKVTEEIDNTWEVERIWARDLEYIRIVKQTEV